jgi:hypothetical protein
LKADASASNSLTKQWLEFHCVNLN